MLEFEEIPAVGQMAVRADFLDVPKNLELISMRVVVAATALLKARHLSDFRSMATQAGNISVGSR